MKYSDIKISFIFPQITLNLRITVLIAFLRNVRTILQNVHLHVNYVSQSIPSCVYKVYYIGTVQSTICILLFHYANTIHCVSTFLLVYSLKPSVDRYNCAIAQ